MINEFPQVEAVLPVTVTGVISPCPHLTHDPSGVFSLPCPVEEGSDRVASWAPGTQPGSALHSLPQAAHRQQAAHKQPGPWEEKCAAHCIRNAQGADIMTAACSGLQDYCLSVSPDLDEVPQQPTREKNGVRREM